MKTVRFDFLRKIRESLVPFFKKIKPANRQEWIRTGILAVSIPVFLYCAIFLGIRLFAYVSEDWKNEQITELKPTPSSNPFDSTVPSSSSGETAEERPYQVLYATDTGLNAAGHLPEYEDLWQRNNDLAGWIHMPGFPVKTIYYPILYSGDNSYYVYKNFDKEYSYSGSVFLDGANSPYQSDPLDLNYNYVIYGHAMNNKSMFGNLTDYFKNEDSWKNATTIYIDFLNTRLEYTVFATFLVEPDYNYRQTHFSSDEEYQLYLDDMLAMSTHDFGIEVGPDDRIVTLSTCYKSTRRTAVIGKLVRQIIYPQGSSSGNPSVTPVVLPTYEPTPTPKPSSSAVSGSLESGSSLSGSSSSDTSLDSSVDASSDSSSDTSLDPSSDSSSGSDSAS